MIKNVIKEIVLIILTLMLIVIGSIIVVYIISPDRIKIEESTKYQTSEEHKKELSVGNNDSQKEIVQTFIVDDYQLNQYKAVESYVPGKPDPFSSYVKEQGSGEVEGGTTTEVPNINGTKSEYTHSVGTK